MDKRVTSNMTKKKKKKDTLEKLKHGTTLHSKKEEWDDLWL